MPDQQELSLSSRARHSDPVTSHIAGHTAECFIGKHEKRILTALNHGPMDAYQIGVVTNLTNVQVSRRMSELRSRNQVREVGGGGHSPSGGPLLRYALVETDESKVVIG